jgi:dTDP-4-dehydrorhamnose reductase
VTTRRAVVVGASGAIGGRLAGRLVAEGWAVVRACRTPRSAADLRLDLSAAAVTWPFWPRADVTYICAGAGGLEECERDPAATRRVNVEGVGAIARHAAGTGSRVVFVSTSHVFEGEQRIARASDPRRPRTEYGRQKAEAELAVLELPGAAVLRCSKVIGPGDARLLGWHRALLAGRSVEAFDDLRVAPLSMEDAVAALIAVGDAAEEGVFQLSATDDVSYFSMALALAGFVGAPSSLVVRASAQAAGVPAAWRPRGVLLEQKLPRPIDPAPYDVVIARALNLTRDLTP